MSFVQVAKHFVESQLGSIVGKILPDRPYWAVKMDTGRFHCELDVIRDSLFPLGARPFDWTLDLVATGDIRRVKELWLFCPANEDNPQGQTARLPIIEPYTAFQLKVSNFDAIGASGNQMASQLIGRVTDKAVGLCECFVWDTGMQVLGTWETNVYRMGSWRQEIAPISNMAWDVLGLRLG